MLVFFFFYNVGWFWRMALFLWRIYARKFRFLGDGEPLSHHWNIYKEAEQCNRYKSSCSQLQLFNKRVQFTLNVETENCFFLNCRIWHIHLFLAAKVIKALTLTDAALGLFLVLPSCVVMLSEDWIFGDGGCVLQGLLSNTLLSSHCFLMLYLTIER